MDPGAELVKTLEKMAVAGRTFLRPGLRAKVVLSVNGDPFDIELCSNLCVVWVGFDVLRSKGSNELTQTNLTTAKIGHPIQHS